MRSRHSFSLYERSSSRSSMILSRMESVLRDLEFVDIWDIANPDPAAVPLQVILEALLGRARRVKIIFDQPRDLCIGIAVQLGRVGKRVQQFFKVRSRHGVRLVATNVNVLIRHTGDMPKNGDVSARYEGAAGYGRVLGKIDVVVNAELHGSNPVITTPQNTESEGVGVIAFLEFRLIISYLTSSSDNIVP